MKNTLILGNNLQIGILSKYAQFFYKNCYIYVKLTRDGGIAAFLYSFRNCYTSSRVIEGYYHTVWFRLDHGEQLSKEK